MRKNVLAVSLSLLSLGLFAQGNFIKDSLDVFINREMKRWNMPGMAIAIVKDGKVIVAKGYGYADVAKKTPVTENTVFQIASNSKAFTGTSLALLEHYGKLKLTDPVKKYLPYFKMKDAYLTEHVNINDVLSHRMGYATFQTDLLNWAGIPSREYLVRNMENVDLPYGFREQYGYCNIGFVAAGEVLKAVSDTTWDDYVKHHFFNPLGMTNSSTYFADFIKNPNSSKAYAVINEKLVEIMPANIDNIGPAASISSSVIDISKWIRMQIDNGMFEGKQVIPSQVIQKTRKSLSITGNGRGNLNHFSTYGLGWFMKDENGRKVMSHGGGANGFLSKTVIIPQEKFGFVILTNSDNQSLFEALSEILIKDVTGQAYFDYSGLFHKGYLEDIRVEQDSVKKWKAEAAKIKPAKDAYKKLEGTYKHPVYGMVTVKANANNAEMYFQHHPQYKAVMQWMGPERLVCEFNEHIAGYQVLRFYEKDGKQILDVKVLDFVDMDHYLFVKESNTFFPFKK